MKHQILKTLIITIVVCAYCQQTQAHYLWVVVEKGKDDNRVASIYFEESPSAGDGHYLDHFLGFSDVWLRTLSDPTPKPVKAKEIKQDKNRWMRVAMPDTDDYSIDTYGKFGVYEYGNTKVLLPYYARTINATSHDALHELGRAEQIELDLVPHDVRDGLELTLYWKEKTVPNRMVFIRGPQGFRKNVKTDDRGRVLLESQKEGRYTFRSSVEEPKPGEENGEDYELVRYNITMLLVLPSGK